MKVQGSEVFSQTSTFDYLFEWVKSLYDHDIRNRGNDVSSFCDLWLSPSAGVKLLETWNKLLWLQQVFRKVSKDTNLLFINSQLCIDLLCTPSALALLYIIIYSAHGSQSNKSKWEHVTFLLILNGFLSCFKYAKLDPTSRFSCWLFPLPGMLSPRSLQGWLPHWFESHLN